MRNLRARIERALVEFVQVKAPGELVGFPIHRGQTDETLPDECAVIVAENNTAESTLMGMHANFSVRVVAMVRTNANDTTPTVHQEKAEALRDVLTDEEGIRLFLSAYAVHLYAMYPEGTDEAVDGDRFATALNYSLRVVDKPNPAAPL